MRCLIHTVSARLLFGLIACAALTSIAPAQPVKQVEFAHDIEPILKARCAKCHTNGTRKGSFSMDTRADILKTKSAIPGKSADSEIVKRITSADKDVRMPPGKDPLSPREVALMKAWIDEGLSWQEGFSFKVAAYVPPLKPRRPDLPPAQAGRDHPIDRIVDAYFAKHKVQPPNYLDEPAFVRRIYLDLIGVLPSPSEVDTFRADTSADKRQRLIHQLLNDKRSYSDHWLSFWNDMLRNDYAGTGYIDGGRKQITGWLYRALIQTIYKPYDQVRPRVDQPDRRNRRVLSREFKLARCE